jgi:hypothetical protein
VTTVKPLCMALMETLIHFARLAVRLRFEGDHSFTAHTHCPHCPAQSAGELCVEGGGGDKPLHTHSHTRNPPTAQP